MCFSPYLGIKSGGGGGSQGMGTPPAGAVFHHGELKIEAFETYFFSMVST